MRLTWRQSNAVSFIVQQPPHLGELTLSLHHVVHHGALHHEGVLAVRVQDPLHPLLVGGGPHVVVLLHVLPHPGVGRDLGILENQD